MDGKVVIGTALSTRELERELKKADKELTKFAEEEKQLMEEKMKIEAELKLNTDEYDKKTTELKKQFENALVVESMKDESVSNIKGVEIIYQQKLNALNSEYQQKNDEIVKIRDEINKKTQNNVDMQKILNEKMEEYKREIIETEEEKERASRFADIKDGVDGIGKSLAGAAKKVVMLGLAFFGIRSAYSFLLSSMNTLSSYNTQIQSDIKYIKFALATTLEPVIQGLINLAYKLLGAFSSIIKAVTGINIFKNAGIDRFQQGLDKSVGSAKELNKQLAGFDEMNVLQDNSGGGGGGGASAPQFDLSNLENLGDGLDLFGWIKEQWEKMKEWIYSINWQELGANVYNKIKEFITGTDWASMFDGFFEGLGAIFGAVGGFIVGFLTEAWKDISDYFSYWIKESEKMGGGVIGGLFLGIINAIAEIGKWIYDHVFTPFINGFKKAFGIHSPSTVMQEMGTFLVDGLKNGLIGIWNKLKGIFDSLKNNIINIFSQTWNGITKVFSGVESFFRGIVNKIYSLFRNIGSSVGNVVGGAFKSVINSVLGSIEGILNSPIKAINSLIKTVNTIPGVNIGKLSTFKFPRMAKGGILNMPGRGVNYGGANIGEKRPEGVIPYTDNQVMALLGKEIGKYITINATITNTMNGRVISRELQKINNENDFAFNR